MSKVSDWIEALKIGKASEPAPYKEGNGDAAAWARDTGDLWVARPIQDPLAFARWIHETYGEGPVPFSVPMRIDFSGERP